MAVERLVQEEVMNKRLDFEETRTHILLAGREILLAAQGALKFCSAYVEASNKSSPHLKAFFKRAMTVADELGSGLKDMDSIKRAASSVVNPIFALIENEMATEKQIKNKRRKPASTRRRAVR